MSQKQKSGGPVLVGHLEAFSDQGSEGTHWMFVENDIPQGKTIWDVTHKIEKGDLLRVFNDASLRDVAWEGEVDLDYEINKKPNRIIPSWILQQIDGIGTVHGIQKDVAPEEWGRMFVEEKPALFIPRNPKP